MSDVHTASEQLAADFTARTLRIMNLLHDGDVEGVKALLAETDDTHGWTGLLCLVRAVAKFSLDVCGMAAQVPLWQAAMASAERLDALIDSMFMPQDPHDDWLSRPERRVLAAGIRFLVTAADDERIPELKELFHQHYLDMQRGLSLALTDTIGGVLTLWQTAVHALPEQARDVLLTMNVTAAKVLSVVRPDRQPRP